MYTFGGIVGWAIEFVNAILRNVAVCWATVCLAGALLACGETPTDIVSSSAVVYGTVTSAAGAPVAGALAVVDLYFDGCPATSNPMMTSKTQAGASGSYRVVVGALNLTGPRCIRVSVSANGMSLVKESTVSIWPQQSGSVRVDFTVR